ncbi:MAG: lipopolysaccharide biosynthesis protein [Formivibrio sp.]|nr:lipopolysaccharide biosynthesis protein [Formivibrio sp.]
MSGDRGLFGSSAMWSVLDNFAQQFLSFIIFMILARILTPEKFGLLAIANLIVTVVRQTAFEAIAMPVSRDPEPNDNLYSWAFSLCTILALLLAVGMILLAGPLSIFYKSPELRSVLIWMSPVVVFFGLARAYEARLIRQMQFKPLAIRSIISVTIGGVVGIVLALKGVGVMALVIQQVVIAGLAFVMLVVQSSWRPRWCLDRSLWKKYQSDIAQVGQSGALGFFTSQADTLLVSIFLGSHATGLYNFAKRLTSAIYLIIASSMLKVAVPAFSDAFGNVHKLQSAYVRVIGLSLFVLLPSLLGMGVMAEPLISVFFGAVWMPAAKVVLLLAMLNILLTVNQLNDYLLFAVGENVVPVKRGFYQFALAILLGWFGSRFGLVWMTSAFVVAALIVLPWAQHHVCLYIGKGFWGLCKIFRGPMLGSLVMVGILLPFAPLVSGSMSLVLGMIFIAACTYMLVHYLLLKYSVDSYDAMKDLGQFRRAG